LAIFFFIFFLLFRFYHSDFIFFFLDTSEINMAAQQRVADAVTDVLASENGVRQLAFMRFGRQPTEEDMEQIHRQLLGMQRCSEDTSHTCPCCGAEGVAATPVEKMCFDCLLLWRCIQEFHDHDFHPLEPDISILCNRASRENILRIASYFEGLGANLRVKRMINPENGNDSVNGYMFQLIVTHPGTARSVKAARRDAQGASSD
jgi:hypothetical protein